LSSIPFSFPNGLHNEKLFDRKDRESKAKIFPIELFQMFSPSQIREGGFFVMIGKKNRYIKYIKIKFLMLGYN
tara:strand:+ start:267 stop:485 length:219 start_codon:yes stop_codon:yes gene_type:complete